eukprot:877944-Pyramimonas_sp.AAC.1
MVHRHERYTRWEEREERHKGAETVGLTWAQTPALPPGRSRACPPNVHPSPLVRRRRRLCSLDRKHRPLAQGALC